MTTDLQDIPPAGTPVPGSPAGASVDVSVAGPPPGPGTAEARPVEESDGARPSCGGGAQRQRTCSEKVLLMALYGLRNMTDDDNPRISADFQTCLSYQAIINDSYGGQLDDSQVRREVMRSVRSSISRSRRDPLLLVPAFPAAGAHSGVYSTAT